MTVPRLVLPAALAVLLASTAVYFMGSAAAPTLAQEWGLGPDQAAAFSWSTQAGFIAGTLLVAATNVADRVPANRLMAALLAASAATSVAFAFVSDLAPALALRFLAGALAGPVYPVGMKLLASWYPRLGRELGWLLGAYTLGAGAAFGLSAVPALAWQAGSLAVAALGLAGAALALALRPGPLLPPTSPFDARAALRAFRVPAFRRSALAYFGHMWELFALWAALPFWLAAAGLASAPAVAAGAFVAGAAACVLGGLWSRRVGEARVARVALGASAACCLLSPFAFAAPPAALVAFALVWGAAVIADSPMFSALSARAAPKEYVGTALTVQNSVGFALTVVAIAVVPLVADAVGWRWALVALAPGPLLGLLPLAKLASET